MLNGLVGAASRFGSDNRGATAIEYALVASLISMAILGALTGTSDTVGAGYQNIMERVSAALSGE